MRKVELAPLAISLMLTTTPAVADVTRELTRCQLEAERLYPTPPDKGAENWAVRAANLQKRAEGIETCMRAAGYSVTSECSAPLKTYESCMRPAIALFAGAVPLRVRHHFNAGFSRPPTSRLMGRF